MISKFQSMPRWKKITILLVIVLIPAGFLIGAILYRMRKPTKHS